MFKFLFLVLLLISCGDIKEKSSIKEAINQKNDPRIIPGAVLSLEYVFDNLPDSGKIDRLWKWGWWWPLSEGGTASTRYGSPNPMAKYDSVTGSSAEKWELDNAKKYATVNWAGECNGEAASEIMMEEPVNSVTYKDITFSAIDVRALLTAAWQGSGAIVGERCDDKDITYDGYGRMVNESCRNVNPGTFHIALTNYLGLFGKAIIADITLTAVWNYPVEAYNVTLKEKITRDEAMYYIQKRSPSMYVYNEAATNFAHVKIDVSYLNLETRSYEYILELDSKGKILGGEWLENSKKDHPNYIWRPQDPKPVNSNLDLKVISEIYLKSL